jgi:hypothetical protein
MNYPTRETEVKDLTGLVIWRVVKTERSANSYTRRVENIDRKVKEYIDTY